LLGSSQALQALALEREVVEEIVDYVKPDEKGMEKVKC
jgi:hypothetical protein